MPDAQRVTIFHEPVKQLEPVLVSLEEAEAGHQFEPRERARHVGLDGVAMRQPVAEHEVLLLDQLFADLLHGLLTRQRLRQMRVELLDLRVVFVPEVRHVRQHPEEPERRRRGLAGQHLLVADANPRLGPQRRTEIVPDAQERASRGAPQARVVLVSRLGEQRGGTLAQHQASASPDFGSASLRRQQIEEVLRIVVLGEQPEEQPAGVHERWRLALPAVLEEATHREHRTDPLEVLRLRRRKPEHALVPRTVTALREGERHRRREAVRLRPGTLGQLGGKTGHLCHRAVLDGRCGVIQ